MLLVIATSILSNPPLSLKTLCKALPTQKNNEHKENISIYCLDSDNLCIGAKFR